VARAFFIPSQRGSERCVYNNLYYIARIADCIDSDGCSAKTPEMLQSFVFFLPCVFPVQRLRRNDESENRAPLRLMRPQMSRTPFVARSRKCDAGAPQNELSCILFLTSQKYGHRFPNSSWSNISPNPDARNYKQAAFSIFCDNDKIIKEFYSVKKYNGRRISIIFLVSPYVNKHLSLLFP